MDPENSASIPGRRYVGESPTGKVYEQAIDLPHQGRTPAGAASPSN
jgi:hypothetical protein